MKKFYFALVTLLSVMFASCSSDDSPILGEEGHLYSITFKVTGHSPRGNAHLINLDGVKFKCEQTGVSQSSVDEPFSGTATYTTEGLVKEMTVQGVLYSTENGTLSMRITQDGKEIYHETKELDVASNPEKTIDLTFTTMKGN